MGRPFFIWGSISLLLTIILFFPIYLDANAHYDMNGRKCAFSLQAYRIIKLIGGYIATYRGGLAVHVSPKKAFLVPYSDLDNERKRFSVIRTFRLKTLNVTAETGAEYLLPVMFAYSVFQVYFLMQNGRKEAVRNNLWLREGDVLRVSLSFTIRFNLFIILRNIFSYLKERIKVLCQTKNKRSIN